MIKKCLLDIDGTLIIQKNVNGNRINVLNPAIIDILKANKYDEIILFTQRCVLIQSLSLNSQVRSAIDPEKEIISTPQAIQALTEVIKPKKPIRVSTSVDLFFGKPTDYYNDVLEKFETSHFLNLVEAGNEGQVDISGPYNKEVKGIQEKWHNVHGSSKPIPAEANSLIPNDKKLQYKMLVDQLLRQQSLESPLESKEPFTIDFFDDHLDNLSEVADECYKKRYIISPSCFFVLNENIYSSSSIALIYGDKPAKEITAAIHAGIEAKKRGMTLETSPALKNLFLLNLQEYIRGKSYQEEVSKFQPKFFTALASMIDDTQRTAVVKSLALIQNTAAISPQEYDYKRANFTNAEIQALKTSRTLRNLFNEYLPEFLPSLPTSFTLMTGTTPDPNNG